MGNPFKRDPAKDPAASHKRFADPERGLHTFFRHSTVRMQERFCELLERSSEEVPRAFLHGNPHLDNYAKSSRGVAMVDFDRSRLGPCAYDVVRFLISVSLRSAERPKDKNQLLAAPVLENFRRGYAHGVLSRALGYEEMLHLRGLPPKRWQESTRAYIRSRRRWAAKLKAFSVKPTKKRMRALLQRYLRNRDELHLLERYRVHQAARVPGSQGKLHHVYWLRPKDDEESRDDLLLDVKEVYDEPDTEHFSNPFRHNGLRMIAAGALYAPGWDQRPGWVTYKGTEYWCRQVPLQNAKLKRPLSPIEQMEVCYAVGSQLGRGHALSASMDPLDLHELFNEQFPWQVELAEKLRAELAKAHRRYLDALGSVASA